MQQTRVTRFGDSHMIEDAVCLRASVVDSTLRDGADGYVFEGLHAGTRADSLPSRRKHTNRVGPRCSLTRDAGIADDQAITRRRAAPAHSGMDALIHSRGARVADTMRL